MKILWLTPFDKLIPEIHFLMLNDFHSASNYFMSNIISTVHLVIFYPHTGKPIKACTNTAAVKVK